MKKKIKIDGVEYEVEQEVADAYEAMMKKANGEKKDAQDKIEALEKAVTEEKASVIAEKKRADTAEGKVDSLTEEVKKKTDAADPKKFQEAVASRIALLEKAKPVLKDELKADQSDIEIMKAVILKQSPEVKLDGKSDEYIQARFDSISEMSAEFEKRRTQFSDKFTKNDTRKDSDFDASAARQKAIDEAKKAWEQPLASHKK